MVFSVGVLILGFLILGMLILGVTHAFRIDFGSVSLELLIVLAFIFKFWLLILLILGFQCWGINFWVFNFGCINFEGCLCVGIDFW